MKPGPSQQTLLTTFLIAGGMRSTLHEMSPKPKEDDRRLLLKICAVQFAPFNNADEFLEEMGQ